NIRINNGFHPHVWFKNSGDVFKHNLVFTTHQPIGITDWGSGVDSNYFITRQDLQSARSLGVDQHSIWGQPRFLDPDSGDYRLHEDSPFLKAGFLQPDLENIGVRPAWLRKLAAPAPVPELMIGPGGVSRGQTYDWHGVLLKPVETPGEQSAAGLNEIRGLRILEIKGSSPLAGQCLQAGDVI